MPSENQVPLCACLGSSTHATEDPAVRRCDMCGGDVPTDPATGAFRATEPSDIAFVEQHTHPSDKVTIIERWVPAGEGEYAPFLFRPAGSDAYVPMKLESRKIVDVERSEPHNSPPAARQPGARSS